MQKYNILELNEKQLPELQDIAETLDIKKVKSLPKEELIYKILDEQAISWAGIQVEKEARKKEKIAQKSNNMQQKTIKQELPYSEKSNDSAEEKKNNSRRGRPPKNKNKQNDEVTSQEITNAPTHEETKAKRGRPKKEKTITIKQ